MKVMNKLRNESLQQGVEHGWVSQLLLIGWTGLIAWAGTGCDSGAGEGTAKAYPLSTCLVSGEAFGVHGPAYSFVHQGREIKLCCRDCLKEFQKAPAKYLARLEGGMSNISSERTNGSR